MKILALDQASRVSGWAIFANNDLLTYGKIDLSKQDDIGERLHLLRQKVKQLIKEYKIEKVILEDIYMDQHLINNVQTFKILAEVFGVLFELCISIDIPVEAVLSGTWKSTLRIKGKNRPEQKHSAQEWVLNNYNIKTNQDTVDAICIGAYYLKQKQVNSWSM